MSPPGNRLQPQVKVQTLRLREPVRGVGGGDEHVDVMFPLVVGALDVRRPREVVIATLDGVEDAVPADVAWFTEQEPGKKAG